jgi:hypothetical protein
MFNDRGSVDVDPWMRRLAAMTRRICGVEIGGQHVATGFLIGPGTVLTCAHAVLPLVTQHRAGMRACARFDAALSGQECRRLHGTAVELDADWLVGMSAPARDERHPREGELDVALLRLAQPAGHDLDDLAGARGWIDLHRVREPSEGEMAILLQRSRPRALQLAPAYVRARRGARVTYEAVTEGGSSGSPLFDLRWNLLAIHVADDPDTPFHPTLKRGVPALDVARLFNGW